MNCVKFIEPWGEIELFDIVEMCVGQEICVGGEGGMCGNSYTDICPGSEAVSLVISINGCVGVLVC